MDSVALHKALKALPADTPQRRVRVALAYRGQTQSALARGTGIDPGLLSNAMNGHRNLTGDQESAIAGFLGVPVSILFPEVAA